MNSKRTLLNIALPAMVENLLQMLMGLVDSYLVSQISLIAVSGVSVANNIISIYQALFIALGAAISSLIAKSRGEKNISKQFYYQAQGLLVTIIISFILGIVTVFFGKNLLALFGMEKAVADSGGLYLKIVGGLIVSLGLLTTLASFLRAQGKTRLPMYVSLLINLVNALLSALAVFVFDWGIVGVAIATVLSRFIGIALLGSQLPVKKILENLTLSLDKNLLTLSLPAAGERLMMRAGDVVIIAIVVQFGTEAVAGNAIGESLTQFNYMPGLGMATATVILVAHYLGSGDYYELKKIVRESYLISACLMIIVGLLTFLFGDYWTSFFTENSGARQASLVVLFYSFIGGPATAGTLIFTAVWQGLGNSKMPFYATSFGMWFVRILLGYVLGVTLNLGLSGVWLATLVDNFFRWGFLYIKYMRVSKGF